MLVDVEAVDPEEEVELVGRALLELEQQGGEAGVVGGRPVAETHREQVIVVRPDRIEASAADAEDVQEGDPARSIGEPRRVEARRVVLQERL